MSTDTPEPPEDTPAPVPTVPTPPPADTLAGQPTAGDDKPSGEAAKWRRQLRDVEADRDGLRTTITTLQTAEAERIAAAAGLTAVALWASGAVLADLLNETGAVDPAKVAAAATAAKTILGIPPTPATPSAAGQGSGTSIGDQRPARTFADAFNPERQRYDD